jgi:MFS family permease
MNDAEARKKTSSSVSPRLPFTVVALGITSFFTDVGSEMIFPLLPLFMTSLGAAPAFLGLVEGGADFVSSMLKLGSGYLADRMPRKKPLVLLGYGLAGVARPLMALAAVPWHVLAVRVTDRVGKGIRTAPRDALISGAVSKDQAGRAFGLHRAMDHAGAVLGPLVATGLLAFGWTLREVFLATVVPGALALFALILIREHPRPAPDAGAPASHSGAAAPPSAAAAPAPPLPRAFVQYLVVVGLFALGNASDAFLLLRARDLGVPEALVPTLWTVLHVSKLGCTYWGGMLADRHPRTRLIAIGWGVFALAYFGLAYATTAWHAWALFVFYGLFYGLTEPTERALVKDLAPASAQGRAFGLYNFVLGIAAVPAGLLMGFVWQTASPRAALLVGAGIGLLSCVLLLVQAPRWQRA